MNFVIHGTSALEPGLFEPGSLLPGNGIFRPETKRPKVSVAGKRNFHGGDKEAETALEIQGCRRRDKISLGNPADSGLIAGFGEISVRARMRGGPGRTRTSNQAVMSQWSAIARPQRNHIGISIR